MPRADSTPSGMPLARQQPSVIATPWLIRLRWFSLAALVGAGLAADRAWHVSLPLLPLGLLVGAMAAANLVLTRLLRLPHPPREQIGTILVVDVLLLSGTLYFVGGPLNPLSIVSLVSITIAAIVLGHQWGIAVAVVANVAYALTFVYNRPLHFHDAEQPSHMLSVHLWGMWVAFATASALMAHFVGRVSEALAQRERELDAAHALAARSERMAALFSLGAGAAHELATPLSTIGTAAGELQRLVNVTSGSRRDGHHDESAVAAYVDTIRREVDRCAVVLDHLSGRAQSAGIGAGVEVELPALVDELRHRLGASQARRLTVELPDGLRPVSVPAEPLRQTLVALVQNGLDASRADQAVTMRIAFVPGLRVAVCDAGRGMTDEEAARASEPFFTTKAPGGGLGLGLFLARSFAEQMQGSLRWRSTIGRGTEVVLDLPHA